MGNDMLSTQGTPQPFDKTLKQVYIDAIKNHIELLEAKKREAENCFTNEGIPNLTKGFIQGLNYAIDQLYSEIKQLKDK